jgi:hypothetical protein
MAKKANYCLDCHGPCRCTHQPITGTAYERPYHSPGFTGTVVGRKLSNRTIAKYQSKGYYASGFIRLKSQLKHRRHRAKLTLEAFLNS